MRRLLMIMATAAGVTLLVCGVANADTVTANFESPTFQPNTVNAQDGWRSAPLHSIPNCDPTPTQGAYDQAVVPNLGTPPLNFGLQSLRISNACGNGEFFFQTYSRATTQAAGEKQPNNVFIAQFSFISKTPAVEQPGLFVSVSPDSSEGSRMSWVGLEDTPTGIHVTLSDTPKVDGDFVDHDLGVLPRNVPHTIKFWIRTNPGVNNDLVRVAVDGADAGQCFTTWENYYRTAPEQAPPPNINNPASINSLQFRTSVPGPAPLLGAGYLFDNVSITTSNNPAPPDCNLLIDKKADQATVTAGSRVGYQITVRNRGGAIARNVWACDHIPKGTTFVSADHALRRLGSERCLVIPSLRPGASTGFHLVLKANAVTPQSTLTNIADVTPIDPPGLPGAGPPGAPVAELPGTPASPALPLLPVVDVPGTPAGPAALVPVQVAKAVVKVKAAKAIVKAKAKRSIRTGTKPGIRAPRVTG